MTDFWWGVLAGVGGTFAVILIAEVWSAAMDKKAELDHGV